MLNKKVTKMPQGKRIWYKTSHPLYGKDNTFDSWMTLCECTTEIALHEAKVRLNESLIKLSLEISDEMVNTAEEYEPETDNR